MITVTDAGLADSGGFVGSAWKIALSLLLDMLNERSDVVEGVKFD